MMNRQQPEPDNIGEDDPLRELRKRWGITDDEPGGEPSVDLGAPCVARDAPEEDRKMTAWALALDGVKVHEITKRTGIRQSETHKYRQMVNRLGHLKRMFAWKPDPMATPEADDRQTANGARGDCHTTRPKRGDRCNATAA